MIEVEVVNKDILAILNEYLWFYDRRDELDPKASVNTTPATIEDIGRDKADLYTSKEYLQKIVNQGSAHDGFPRHFIGWNLKHIGNPGKVTSVLEVPTHWKEKHVEVRSKLMEALCVKKNAVATLYPPDGYISWHNNANAYGFNLLFTWSETGDGYLEYIDEEGKSVVLPDKKGQWVCRYGHFGSYDDTEYPLVYHTARTDCWRITVAFLFEKSEASSGVLQDFIIEELTTP